MASLKLVCGIVLALVASSLALPTQMNAPVEETWSWRTALMDGSMEDLQKECAENNEISCMKYKVLHFVDEFFTKETVQVTEDMTLVKNDAADAVEAASARSADAGFVDVVENYVQSHDVVLSLPGSTMLFSPRNLDHDEINFSLNFAQPGDTSVEARKSKVKKILIPILVFVLLKAMTLIPLFIGALGLKAWNALQLSFFSFVISVALAVFQLCKKIAADSSHAHAHPVVAAHSPWEYASHYAARAFDVQVENDGDAHDLAYSARNE